MRRGRVTYGAGRKRISCWRLMLLAVVICSLIHMGCLFWIDNTWAVIADNDPTTQTDIGLLLPGCSGESQAPADLNAPGQGSVPVPGGVLVAGNGDQDDNREESFFFRLVTRGRVLPRKMAAAGGFRDRRTVAAYKDFGHLKVMSDGEAASDGFAVKSLDLGPRPPVYCIAGGLLYCEMTAPTPDGIRARLDG